MNALSPLTSCPLPNGIVQLRSGETNIGSSARLLCMMNAEPLLALNWDRSKSVGTHSCGNRLIDLTIQIAMSNPLSEKTSRAELFLLQLQPRECIIQLTVPILSPSRRFPAVYVRAEARRFDLVPARCYCCRIRRRMLSISEVVNHLVEASHNIGASTMWILSLSAS